MTVNKAAVVLDEGAISSPCSTALEDRRPAIELLNAWSESLSVNELVTLVIRCLVKRHR